MPITILGIRVNDIHIEADAERGGFRIKSAEYSLVSSTGKVLAKQSIGGYNGMALEASVTTKGALDAFASGYVADVQGLLGLLE